MTEISLSRVRRIDLLRGHSILPSKAELATIPALYATDGVKLEDKIVYQHFFIGGCDWFLFELDPDEWRAFGFVNLGDSQNAEMGYFSLIELGCLTVTQRISIDARRTGELQIPVERELNWTPAPFGEVR